MKTTTVKINNSILVNKPLT